jgi:hypothetical protein
MSNYRMTALKCRSMVWVSTLDLWMQHRRHLYDKSSLRDNQPIGSVVSNPKSTLASGSPETNSSQLSQTTLTPFIRTTALANDNYRSSNGLMFFSSAPGQKRFAVGHWLACPQDSVSVRENPYASSTKSRRQLYKFRHVSPG